MNQTATDKAEPLRIETVQEAGDLRNLWNEVDVLRLPRLKTDRYILGFACSDRSVRLAQRLRFEVFNLELKEGLESSFESGLDIDPFDAQMDHMVLLDREGREIVGTYRLQTVRKGLAQRGLYASEEYDLKALEPLYDDLVECGRACLAPAHRNFAALHMLWLGIAGYLELCGQRYLFGCCSLNTTDPDDGWRAMKTIRAQEYLHKSLFLPAQPTYCCGDPAREFDPELGDAIRLPKLFSAYMRLGCEVISQPALDRDFGTVDFLILLDQDTVKMSTLTRHVPGIQ